MSTKLADLLCTYRNVPHTSTGYTLADLLFDRAPCTHLSMVLPNVSERVNRTLHSPKVWKPSNKET